MGIRRIWAKAPRLGRRIWHGGSRAVEPARLVLGRRPPHRRDRSTRSGNGRKIAGRKGIGPRPDFSMRRGRPRRSSNFGGSVSDEYAQLVNAGLTGKLAKALGLPRPARLRRYAPGDDPAPGPVLILDGGNAASSKDRSEERRVGAEGGSGRPAERQRRDEGREGAMCSP